MFSNLDATSFSGAIPFYDTNFEDILSKITLCYQMMVTDSVPLNNNENGIRDTILLRYLKNNQIREEIGVSQWLFDREVPEDLTVGRTDIKISSIQTFSKTEAYYIIECKRLNNVNVTGPTGLNAEYVKNGIFRYTEKYYSSYYRVNAMIGFVVEQMDIHSNVDKINDHLVADTSINTSKVISKDGFIDDFQYQYHSTHIDKDNEGLKIYHLMYDFHKNIN